jgi:hypothetical protein
MQSITVCFKRNNTKWESDAIALYEENETAIAGNTGDCDNFIYRCRNDVAASVE